MPLSRFVISFVLLAWTSAVAAEPPRVIAIEGAWNGFTTLDAPLQADGDSDAIQIPKIVYRHDDASLRVLAPPGADMIWAEDVHLTEGGMLARLWFAYYMDPDFHELAYMSLWVYENDAEDTIAPDPENPLLGPIVFGPLVPPTDSRIPAYAYILPQRIPVGKDLWLAVQFTHDNPGLVVAKGEPRVGTTHDMFYDFSSGKTTQLPGYPSNFVFEVRVDPVTAVQDVTWSGIKALYVDHEPPPPALR